MEMRFPVSVYLCMEGRPILKPHISVGREIFSLNVKIEIRNTTYLNLLFCLFSVFWPRYVAWGNLVP